jgi:hypothetical protein
MSDSISLKVLPEMRAFLEAMAEKHHVGLCEAGRIIIENAMTRARAGEEI